MVGPGFHLEPWPFQGQLAKDYNRAPHSGNYIVTGIVLDLPPAGPLEQMTRAYDTPLGSPRG
jgi:hypothetical protein